MNWSKIKDVIKLISNTVEPEINQGPGTGLNRSRTGLKRAEPVKKSKVGQLNRTGKTTCRLYGNDASFVRKRQSKQREKRRVVWGNDVSFWQTACRSDRLLQQTARVARVGAWTQFGGA